MPTREDLDEQQEIAKTLIEAGVQRATQGGRSETIRKPAEPSKEMQVVRRLPEEE